jgi:hypothetical protein
MDQFSVREGRTMRAIPRGAKYLTGAAAAAMLPVLVVAASPAQAVAAPSALWNFSVAAGTSRVNDVDGSAQNLTLKGKWSASTGYVNFTGTPSYGTVSGSTFSPGDLEFAFGAVVRTSSVAARTNPNVIQGGMGHDVGQYKIALQPTSGGTAVCVLNGRSAKLLFKSTVTGLANGAWHEIICSRQAGSVSISVDGITSTYALSPGTIKLTTGRPVLVASKGSTTTAADQLIGSIDCAGIITGAGARAALAAKMPC